MAKSDAAFIYIGLTTPPWSPRTTQGHKAVLEAATQVS